MTAEELYGRCMELVAAEPSAAANRFMHETLVLCCAEGLKTADTAFGNLFAQVDYLSKRRGLRPAERRAVQLMRRYSNHTEACGREEWLQHVGTLARFVAAVSATAMPQELARRLTPPVPRQPADSTGAATRHATHGTPHYRCIVSRWDGRYIDADTADGSLRVDYSGHGYLNRMLREGMQLNLLDCQQEETGDSRTGDDGADADKTVVIPRLVVVEPDFLVDISAIARCFQSTYGHHPLLYTAERLKARGNSQAMLLGNFAGAALDDLIHAPGHAMSDTLNRFFREQALQFATCADFSAPHFTDDARRQWANIGEAVGALFADGGYDRRQALLEPSFVCERLGLQGRVDLMTADMRLLVEQKSGKNYYIESDGSNGGGSTATPHRHKEDHYVQLLLYYGILRYNFGRSDADVDIRLLYSRYPAARGLLYVSFYRELFHEAIRLRNRVVATELLIAREGFGRIGPLLTPAVVYRDAARDGYFHRFIEPPLQAVARQLGAASPLERAYLDRMMAFVYREQLLQKVGRQEGRGGAASDLWNMPLAEKTETGNIILGTPGTTRPAAGDQPCWNFRRGDMVYLYNYDGEPDVRRAILYKGTLEEAGPARVTVRLNEGVAADDIMRRGPWAIEHAGSDQNTNSAIKSLYQFITASAGRRALLLGQRAPEADTRRQLSRRYHPHYDEVLLRACQARDYFLLVGPPGTGKTSMALRFLVEEELNTRQPAPALLLMSYTNRAVDEICAMLDDAGHDYLRIGNESSCDERFRDRLLENRLGQKPRLDDIRRRIGATPIVVGTTSMLQARPWIFQLKRFTLCIVDEASQILEPGLVGLLSGDGIGRFILVGDHKQLPAVVQQSEQESRVSDPLLTAIGISDCRQSLFERLLNWERRCGRTQFTGILRKQGRMHPDIARFPNEMFYHDEQLEPVPLEHQTDTSLHYDLPSLDPLDDLLKQHRVLFFDVAAKPDFNTFSDKANAAEAHLVADLLRRICRFYGPRFNPQKTVGVIVPYRNQIAMIRQETALLGLDGLEQISIDTVERYQGSQRDVIIYSFTVSRPYQLDFLTSNCFTEGGRTIDRKLNVAITRARCQLLMTGNARLLSRNPVFRTLIEDSTFLN